MNILVLGALGHLGTNFIISQSKHYELIVGIDRVSYCSQKRSLVDKHLNKFIQADFTKVNLFDLIIWNDIDLVLNASGSTHVDRSYTHQDEFVHDNIIAVEYLMQVMSKVPNCRLIHLSTDEVYGDNYNSPRKETSMLQPTNFYSATKASGDMIIQSNIKTHKMNNILVLRPNNLTGPWQYPDKVIPLFTKQIINGETIKVHDFGTQRRCFISTLFVCDIISELFYRSYRWPEDNPFVNVGYTDQNGLSVLELISTIQKKIKKYDSNLEFVKGRMYNDKHYMICNYKLRKILHDCSFIGEFNKTSIDSIQIKN